MKRIFGISLAALLLTTTALAQDGKKPAPAEMKTAPVSSSEPVQEAGEAPKPSRKEQFGDKGQFTASVETGLQASFRYQDIGNTAQVTVLPALDWFVLDHVSLGAVTGVEFTKAGGTKSLTYILGPRVGYDFKVGDRLSIWPRMGFNYKHGRVKQTDSDKVSNWVDLSFYAPLMIHPSAMPMGRTFFGIGPFLDAGLIGSASDKATAWGIKFIFGGWLPGKKVPL